MKSVKVFNWRYSDGWGDVPAVLRRRGRPDREFHEDMIGWFCHVYTDDHNEFLDWMEANMRGEYDATSRFNSGNPMITIQIVDDKDASLFKLRWI